MDKTEKQQKYNRNPKSKSFGLAIIAVLMLVILLSVSVYFISVLSADEEEPQKILLVNDSLWSSLAAISSIELNTIKEQQRIEREQELARLQEELANEAQQNIDEEDDEPVDDSTGVAYLTFDDGPSIGVTEGILDLLAEEGIKATFFVIYRVDVDDVYKRIVDEGHEIANHSYSHNYNRLYRRTEDAFKEDILRLHDFVLDNFGYKMTTFRFPGGSGSWNRDTVSSRREILAELGYIDYDWHVDAKDAVPNDVDTSAETLTKNVLNFTGGREHAIILMHDYRWRQSTLEALPAIIEGLREQGYRFDTMNNFPQDD